MARKRKKKGMPLGKVTLTKDDIETVTISSSPPASPPQDVVAGQGENGEVQSAASSTLTQRRTTHMADQEELGSIVEYTEDLAEQEAPEPLPPGEYEAEIKGAEAKISNTSGKKYAAVSFYIPVDQYPPDYPVEHNPDGVTIIFRMVPLEDNPRARFQCKRFIEAIGAKPGKRIDLNDWMSLTAMVGVQTDAYEGIPREVITKVSAI